MLCKWFQYANNPMKVSQMEPSPLYFKPGKKTNSRQFFRNCWCPDYDRCMNRAAREDLFLDCTGCFSKDNVMEIFLPFLKDCRRD